jgi:RDD family protein
MMKIGNLRWLLAGLVALCVCMAFVKAPATLGVSAELSNGQYQLSGGTQPWALALAVLIICSYLALLYAEPSEDRRPLPGVFRRLIASWLDLYLAMMAFAPILGLVVSVTEWRRTGIFEWSFERDYSVASDWLLALGGGALSMVVLVLYFAWPLVRRMPSPGACIVGYQVVADDGTSLSLGKAVQRTLLGFVALSAWFLAPFVARERGKGKFWLDKVFDTRAVRI